MLVPRPETETLVEAVLALLAGKRAPSVADIGTGSGAIAVAIAHERPDARVVAVDRSADALAVARMNAAANGVAIELHEGDLLAPLRGQFDAIASNPPYIADGELATLQPEVQREPKAALLAGPDGLAVIRRLVAEAPPLLAEGGALAMEVGAGQAPSVADLMRAHQFRGVDVKRDLAGIERVVIGRR